MSNYLPDFNQIWKLHGKSPILNFTEIRSCDSRDDIGWQMDSGKADGRAWRRKEAIFATTRTGEINRGALDVKSICRE